MSNRRQRHRILIVDDDVDVIEPLGAFFGELGYAVEITTTLTGGQEAANRILPSLVIVGVCLEDADGIDLLRWIRSRPRTAHIPVMFISSARESLMQHNLLKAGADDFIIKPFDVDIVALRVRNAIARTERDGLTEPRTGLPTGRLLQERIQQLAHEDSWAKLEISIQNFAAFRERYDFIAADNVLGFTAHLLSEVSEELGDDDDFIGHRDTERFVFITQDDRVVSIAERIVERFDNEVKKFYSFVDYEQGYLTIEGDGGETSQVSLMTLDVKIQRSA